MLREGESQGLLLPPPTPLVINGVCKDFASFHWHWGPPFSVRCLTSEWWPESAVSCSVLQSDLRHRLGGWQDPGERRAEAPERQVIRGEWQEQVSLLVGFLLHSFPPASVEGLLLAVALQNSHPLRDCCDLSGQTWGQTLAPWCLSYGKKTRHPTRQVLWNETLGQISATRCGEGAWGVAQRPLCHRQGPVFISPEASRGNLLFLC